jgi:hypothetical protein
VKKDRTAGVVPTSRPAARGPQAQFASVAGTDLLHLVHVEAELIEPTQSLSDLVLLLTGPDHAARAV